MRENADAARVFALSTISAYTTATTTTKNLFYFYFLLKKNVFLKLIHKNAIPKGEKMKATFEKEALLLAITRSLGCVAEKMTSVIEGIYINTVGDDRCQV